MFGSRIQLDVLPQLCPSSFSAGPRGGVSPSGSMTVPQCLMQHGYVEWAKYQPISRFWPFQWIEGRVPALAVGAARRRDGSGSSGGERRDHRSDTRAAWDREHLLRRVLSIVPRSW